jgi:hypothetical protein
MARPIQPGSRCLIVGSFNPHAIGRIVIARAYLLHEMTTRGIRSGWLVSAPWLNPARPSIWPERWLVALDDGERPPPASAADTAARLAERDLWLALNAGMRAARALDGLPALPPPPRRDFGESAVSRLCDSLKTQPRA